MNFKDKLVKKLTKVGKKHRILVYPTLALIAIITAISQAVIWSRSNGKKFVASMMVMAMLITQSLFLTSSADYTEPNTPETGVEQTQNGTVENGGQPDGQSQDGQTLDGQTQDGQTQDGQIQDGQTQDAQAQDGQTQDGQTQDGQTQDAQTQDGQTQDGQTQDVQTQDGQKQDVLSQDGNGSDGDAPLNPESDITALLAETTDPTDTPDAPATPQIVIHATDPDSTKVATYDGIVHTTDGTPDGTPNGVTIPAIDSTDLLVALVGDSTHYGYTANDSKFYLDNACTNAITDSTVLPLEADNTYDLYVKIGRKQYDIRYVDEENKELTTAVYTFETSDKLYPEVKFKAPKTAPANCYKWGYLYNGITVNGNTYAREEEIPIQTADGNNTVNLPIAWTPMEGLKLTYKLFTPEQATLVGANKADETRVLENLTYGQSVTSPAINPDEVCTNKGYYLDHWVVEGTDTKISASDATDLTLETGLARKLGDVTDNLNVEGVTLTGVWAYRDINLFLNGEATGTQASITANYGDTVDYTLSAKYLTGDVESETFTFTGIEALTTMLGEYGLSISNADGIYKITGTLNRKVTANTGVTSSFGVTDTNLPVGKQEVTGFGLTLIVNPCPVRIGTVNHATSGGALEKVYDATADISVNTSANVVPVTESAGATKAIADDGITVTFDSTATILETDGVAGKDVGKNKDIRLSGMKLVSSKGDDLTARYVLTGVEDGTLVVKGAAAIKPRTVHVSMALAEEQDDSVMFGENSPKYDITVVDVNQIAPLEQNAYTSDPKAFIENYLGLQDPEAWETNRDIYSPVGNTYYKKATFDNSQNQNYDVIVDGKQEFKVVRDNTENYFEVAETPVNGYYPSYTIVPKAPYTAVRILKAGEGDIAINTPRDTAEKPFTSGNKTIAENGKDMTITFQLLNENNHAISTVYSVTGINIDSSMPVYQSHTAETAGINMFGPVGFGSYYHSQNSEKAMTIKVVYKGEVSPCTTLHYYFTGEDASVKPGTITSSPMRKIGDNLYEGTILVGTAYTGQLFVYAEDEAGKVSGETKLLGENPSGDYYEWMTENEPSTATLTVLGNGESAGPNQWYSSLSSTVDAKDGDSGINHINWLVSTPSGTLTYSDDTPANVTNATYCAKVLSGSFTNAITGKTSSVGGESANYVPGEYHISAEVVDNAGNVYIVPQQGPFLYDGNAPKIEISDTSDTDSEYKSDVTITIAATDGENESGLATVKLYKDAVSDENLLESWGNEGPFEYEVTDSGKYIAVATDVAGNSSEDTVTYSYISSERPPMPTIAVDKGAGENGNSGWYVKERPTITINSVTATEGDQVPVTTYYRVTVVNADGKQESTASFDTASTSFQLPFDGEVMVEAWTVSKSDCRSDTASETVKSDIDAPRVEITDSVVDADGIVTISFKVTDLVSGVNPDKVLVNGNPIAVTDTDGVITGSFQADGSAAYELVAQDKAGNVSEPVSFEPLGLKVSPITSITSNTAHINAQVIQGTNPLSPTNCYIEFKPADGTTYDTVLVNKDEVPTGLEMDYEFTRLTPDTVYDYRVHAASAGGDEERVITGSFKTLSGSDNTSIYGNVSYSVDLDDSFRDYPIYVNLYKGNVQVAGEVIDSAENADYVFKGVADGTYRIVATNGFLTKEALVTVENGGIAYPENYAAANGVNFELSGLSTSVVIDDGEVELAVDGLDKIYNTSLYKGNVTADDLETVKQGGSIDITLHASYIKVSDVNTTESGIFVEKLGGKAEIVRYINLSIEKTVYNSDASVKYSQDIKRLAEPITISFPLDELSGQQIYVASLHSNGANYDFRNWNSADDATLTENYVVISTDRFSTYALYRLLAKDTYTVTWKDGDGKTLKTETVEEGSAATPPEGIPTKTATDKYTYVFEGWDQDYSSINKDTVILALFYSKDITNKEPTNPSDGNSGTGKPGSTGKPGTTGTPGTTVTPGTIVTPGNGSAGNTNTTAPKPPTYSYMGGVTGSPQTGDATPILLVVGLITVCGAAIIVLVKRRKKC